MNSRLLGRLTGYAGLWAIGALALTMVKLVIGFGGNANYLAAVLERVSLSGLASMTLATMTVSVIPVAMVWASATLANPASSPRSRSFSLWALGLGLVLFSRTIPNLYFLLAVVGYLVVRLAQTLLTKRKTLSSQQTPPKPVSLLEWGRSNRRHLDIEMRALAQSSRNAASLSEEDGEALIAKISARQRQLVLPAEVTKLAGLWAASSAFAIGLILAPPTFSASYMVQTTEGSQVAYMVRGSEDILLIDAKTKTPRVWLPGDVLTWRLCGPSTENVPWLLQPIAPSRGDTNLPC